MTIDLKHIIEEIDSLKQQLSPNDEMVQRLTQETSTWVATVKEVIAWVKIKRLIEEEQQKKELSPALAQIRSIVFNEVLSPVVKEKHSNIPTQKISTVASPIKDTLDQQGSFAGKEVFRNEIIAQQKFENNSASVFQSLQESEQSIYRQYCWELANCTSPAKLNDLIEQLSNSQQYPTPKRNPQKGDIVLHGTTITTSHQVWIAPIKTISEFSQFSHQLSGIDVNGNIWLDFSDVFTDSSSHLGIPAPQWCSKNEGTVLLWQRWIDLLFWLAIVPDYVVVLGQKLKQLSRDREEVLNAFLIIHRDFNKAFDKPEQFHDHLGYKLHKLYSAFHQLLCAEDIVFDSIPKHVIANLRGCVNDNINIWRKCLSIHEEHSTGPVNTNIRDAGREFLAGVSKGTDPMSNVSLPLRHPFSEKIGAEKNQVLYWTQPYWKQTQLAPTHHYFELKGSILYCYE